MTYLLKIALTLPCCASGVVPNQLELNVDASLPPFSVGNKIGRIRLASRQSYVSTVYIGFAI